MRSLKLKSLRNISSYLAILALAFAAVVILPTHTKARVDGNTINVTNNSSRKIMHVYVAAPDRDNWSADQLNDASLNSGDSFTINDAACYESGVKVIAEDQDGCFVSTTLSCAQAASWSITDSLVPDCGN